MFLATETTLLAVHIEINVSFAPQEACNATAKQLAEAKSISSISTHSFKHNVSKRVTLEAFRIMNEELLFINQPFCIPEVNTTLRFNILLEAN